MVFPLNCLKKISDAWFGRSDYHTMLYTLYILSGMWMLKHKYLENNPKALWIHRILQVVAFLACVVCFVSFTYDAYLLRKNLEKLSYNLGVTVFFTTALLRFWILTYRRDEFEDVVLTIGRNLHLEDVGRSVRDLCILDAGERHLKRVSVAFYCMLVIGVITKISAHVLTEMALPIPFPYVDHLDTPVYEIVFVLETIGFTHFTQLVITQQMAIDGVFVRVLNHFAILSRNILEMDNVFVRKDSGKEDGEILIGETRSNKVWREYDVKWRQEMIFATLKKNIIHHQELTKLINRMKYAMKEVFFIQIFGGGLLLVDLFLHGTLKKHSLLLTVCQSTYSFAAILDITFICYYGSEVEKQSHKAARDLYAINWLEMDVKNRDTLRFFQLALFKNPVIKAGNVFSINLNMYLKFLNSLYSYMAFMQNSVRTKV